MSSSKERFVAILKEQMTRQSAIFSEAADLEGVWSDRDYLTNLTDDDLDEMGAGITKAQLTAGITLFIQLLNFADNAAVAQGDYRASANALRTDV